MGINLSKIGSRLFSGVGSNMSTMKSSMPNINIPAVNFPSISLPITSSAFQFPSINAPAIPEINVPAMPDAANTGDISMPDIKSEMPDLNSIFPDLGSMAPSIARDVNIPDITNQKPDKSSITELMNITPELPSINIPNIPDMGETRNLKKPELEKLIHRVPAPKIVDPNSYEGVSSVFQLSKMSGIDSMMPSKDTPLSSIIDTSQLEDMMKVT